MNIFNHIKALKITKILLFIPIIAILLYSPDTLTYGICFFLFIIILLDFIIIDKAKNDYQNIYRSAYFDSLTGIPNRLSADIFVAKSTSPDELSVIMADLDGLKTANDTFGHHVGDILIKDFAVIFFETSTPDGFAARNGGDEFLAIFSQDGTGAKAADYCRSLKRNIDIYNETAAHTLSYSIGVAYGSEQKYESIQHLISTADKRMYEEKKSKRQHDKTAIDDQARKGECF